MRHSVRVVKCYPKWLRCPFEFGGGLRCQGWRLYHHGHYHRSDWERRP